MSGWAGVAGDYKMKYWLKEGGWATDAHDERSGDRMIDFVDWMNLRI